ncbi:MAG TPA: two-component regulator propeller domain-containing protein [Chitinophagaceae bacterium]|nr:two-component regulator propeller domain-containing protein [Chitinophagaceae bacterium]
MRLMFAIFFIVIAHYVSIAQHNIPHIQIPAEWLGVKLGLSQGYISSIIQDKDGFMWFGTGDGLNKYDGYKVTVYRNDPKDSLSLNDNTISGLFEDDQGNIWVSTRNKGLSIFNKRTESFYPVILKEVPHHVGIHAMRYQHGKLFILTNANALLYQIDSFRIGYDNKNIGKHVRLLFDYNAQQHNSTLRTEISNHNHVVWVNTDQIWLFNFDTIIQYKANGRYTNWTVKGYSPNTFGFNKNEWYHHDLLCKVNTNIVYAFNGNKIHTVDLEKNKVVETITYDSDKENKINSFEVATLPDHNFIIRKNEQLFHYDVQLGKVSVWQKELVENGIICHNPCLSKEGITWFGTSGFGAIKSDTRKFNFHAYNAVNNMNLFSMVDTNRIDHIPKQIINSLFGQEMSNIVQDLDGLYWAHTFNNRSLSSYNPRAQKITTLPNSYIDPYRRHIFSDQKNRIWIFADYGVNKQYLHQIDKMNGTHIRDYKIPIGTTNNALQFVRDLYSDDEKFVYLATEKGLFRLNYQSTDSNNMWKIFQQSSSDTTSLSSNSLWCICPDPLLPSTYLWLGSSSSGLDRFEIATGKCTNYTEEDGLPNNVVYGILSDKANNLWMSTNRGLSCFNPTSKTFQNFTAEDGLSCDEFNHFEYLKLKNGDLFFGGIGGYTIFNPEKVLQKQKEVPIVFTGLSISNKMVDWKQHKDILDAPITYAKTITLQPWQNMFTINFASLEYRSNQKKFYKFKLQGFDNEWTEPINKNEATFTNLSPGTYSLFVTGTNSDGVWNEKGASIEIVILPAWYQTWWFKVGIGFLFFLGLYGLFRFRLSQQLSVLRVRNRIASDLHDEIGSTLSSIAMYSEAVQKMKSGDEKIPMVINKIHSNTTEVLEAMSDIVWAVNTKNDQLYHLLNRMRDFAVQLSEAKGFDLHITENKNLPDLNVDIDQRKNIYLIFKEALNNAAKYSKCTSVWVDVKLEGQHLKVRIKDDGVGFDESISKNNSGGNGIFNMKRRALDLNGKLDIKSNKDEGTIIELELMLK